MVQNMFVFLTIIRLGQTDRAVNNQLQFGSMEQRALKTVKSCMNTKITFYLETSGVKNSCQCLNVVHFVNTSLN